MDGFNLIKKRKIVAIDHEFLDNDKFLKCKSYLGVAIFKKKYLSSNTNNCFFIRLPPEFLPVSGLLIL